MTMTRTIGDPMKRTTHTSFQRYGIPLGLIDESHLPVYIAQDAFTRQHHLVERDRFIALASGAWRDDEVMAISYTGSIAVIDAPSQTVSHICESDTTPEELKNLDRLVADQLWGMSEPNTEQSIG
jgi:hypothetical protein